MAVERCGHAHDPASFPVGKADRLFDFFSLEWKPVFRRGKKSGSSVPWGSPWLSPAVLAGTKTAPFLHRFRGGAVLHRELSQLQGTVGAGGSRFCVNLRIRSRWLLGEKWTTAVLKNGPETVQKRSSYFPRGGGHVRNGTRSVLPIDHGAVPHAEWKVAALAAAPV